MRRVWIEIPKKVWKSQKVRSPSMRRVWIEIKLSDDLEDQFKVTLHAEGVD